MMIKTTRLYDNKTTSLFDVDYNKIQSSIVKNQSIIRTIFIYVVLNFLTLPLVAQSLPMTLDDCMAYAVEHSTSVGKK
ncbi:MAG: hypothetical protein IKY27_08280, partial [Bacteroidales bacterium]|nr:hypothetical protein [Bacteroidales bacterium]